MRFALPLTLVACSSALFFGCVFPVMAATQPGALLKLSCPTSASPDDRCKAVYFYGHDGKRHAFPNSKVYFSWYADFMGVQTVNPTVLASIPLGQNVTYRPGSKMVKFTSLNKVYTVALGGTLRWVTTETLAKNFYGDGWNTQIDDVSDTFYTDYHFGSDISSPIDYSPTTELTQTPSIDDDLDSVTLTKQVMTERGSYTVTLVQLQRDRFQMLTDTANQSDCTDSCPVKSLADYASADSATIGIHGSYFCPPEYPECVGKTNTFLAPFFNSQERQMLNAGSLAVHEGPMIAATTDGQYFFYHRTKNFGASVSAFEAAHHATLGAALANYPSLVENGAIVVLDEARLDQGQRTTQTVRGAIGFNDHFVYLVVAQKATVVDLASIMKALGATNALNLDGGGSAALLYDNAYLVGPGRSLPNAVLFKKR